MSKLDNQKPSVFNRGCIIQQEDSYDAQLRQAAEAWWDSLEDDKRKEVFIELVVSNQQGGHFIYRWFKELRQRIAERTPKETKPNRPTRGFKNAKNPKKVRS